MAWVLPRVGRRFPGHTPVRGHDPFLVDLAPGLPGSPSRRLLRPRSLLPPAGPAPAAASPPPRVPRSDRAVTGRHHEGPWPSWGSPLQSLPPDWPGSLPALHGDSRSRGHARARAARRPRVRALVRRVGRSAACALTVKRARDEPVPSAVAGVASPAPGHLAVTVPAHLDLRPGLSPFAGSSWGCSTCPAPSVASPLERVGARRAALLGFLPPRRPRSFEARLGPGFFSPGAPTRVSASPS